MNKVKVEIMRYTKNSSSFWLCMLAIVADVLYFTAAFSPIMGSVSVKVGYLVAIDVILNILFMLFTFLCAEKLKVYDRVWPFIAFAFGVAQIIRIFILPALTYTSIVGGEEVINQFITGGTKVQCIVSLIVSAAALFGAGFIGYVKSNQLHAYLKEIEGGK